MTEKRNTPRPLSHRRLHFCATTITNSTTLSIHATTITDRTFYPCFDPTTLPLFQTPLTSARLSSWYRRREITLQCITFYLNTNYTFLVFHGSHLISFSNHFMWLLLLVVYVCDPPPAIHILGHYSHIFLHHHAVVFVVCCLLVAVEVRPPNVLIFFSGKGGVRLLALSNAITTTIPTKTPAESS